MKILHFLPWYTSTYSGGTEQYMINLAKAQKLNGNVVEIIQPNFEIEDSVSCVEGIKINLFSYPDSIKDPQFLFGLVSYYDFTSFRDCLLDFKPDIIHFHVTDARFKYLHKIIKEFNIPTLITPHYVGFSCPDGTLKQNDKKQCNGSVEMFKCSNCIINKNKRVPNYLKFILAGTINILFTITPLKFRHKIKLLGLPFRIHYKKKFLQYLRESPNIKFDVLNKWYADVLNMIDINSNSISILNNEYVNKNNYSNISKKEFTGKLKLLFVGRISYSKGVKTITDAFKKLNEYKDDMELTLIGDMSEKEMEIQLIELIKQGYTINIEGIYPNEAVQKKMKEYDFLIFPSVANEMLPLTIQEAICSDLPIIASNLLGCKALVLEGINGYFFKADDTVDLTKLLTEIILKRKSLAFKFDKSEDINYDKVAYYEKLYNHFLTT